jgi:cytochrome c oxidase accessory protein FixG
MQDKHSVVIGYDVARGEPRGKITRADRAAKKFSLPQLPADAKELRATPLEMLAAEATGATTPAAPAKGDCIDCRRCVVVCPTGIDIRNGLQMECIGCAQCIDACDDVMDKIGRPRGLIRYDSLAGLDGEKRQVLRPRLFAYGGALAVVMVGLVLGSTVGRNPFEAYLLRVRGAPYIFEAGSIRNRYELHLVNKNAADTEFRIEVEVPDHAEVVIPRTTVELGSLESFRLPIFVSVSEDDFHHPFEVEVEVTDGASNKKKEVEARFLGPINPRKHK